jgi:hypothetical protein
MGIKTFILILFLTLGIGVSGQTFDSLFTTSTIVETEYSDESDTIDGLRNLKITSEDQIIRVWALALPFNMVLDNSAQDTASHEFRGSPPRKWIIKNKMATKFYSGFRSAVDSMNKLGQNIQLLLVDHNEKNNSYRIQDDPFNSIYEYSATDFMDICNRLSVEKIIGPFRSEASEILAKESIGIPVINPVSRAVNVKDNPMLIAAAPSRKSESCALGKRAAMDRQNNDSSITVLLLTQSSIRMKLDSSFLESYTSTGRGAIEVVALELSDQIDFNELVSRGPKDMLIRYVLLDNSVLTAAKLLSAFRIRDPELTEFWSMGSVLKSNSLDSYLLLRQPIVWAQTERADYIKLNQIYNSIQRVSRLSPGRWEWLGYDMAWYASYMKGNIPMAYAGPRRLYVWSHLKGHGYINESALLFRFDHTGVRPLDRLEPFNRPQEIDSLIIN